MKAYLIMEDGHIMTGESFGAVKEVISECVFNTSMTGYVEVLTDPSYAGQSVVMTYPLIGNYGVCLDDQESDHPHVSGFIVHELSRLGSNFRKNIDLDAYMKMHDIPGIQGIDTRALTKIIRTKGCMNVMITTEHYALEDVLPRIKGFQMTHAVAATTCTKPYTVGDGAYRVALLDLGMKRNIARELAKRNCRVTIYPAYTKAAEIIAGDYDGIMLSNGPGDPSVEQEIIAQVKLLAKTDRPIFAICLGHQLMALAHGFKTKKMRYGHHGANHPVKNLENNRVYISTQNHNYVIDEASIDSQVADVWFRNVNDDTVEGLTYRNGHIKTVQFHPEASAGPHDTESLFEEFLKMMGGRAHA